MECNTLIQNATIIDGSGDKRFTGDIAIDNGMITAIGHLQGAKAKETIDATGMIVSPGFIDVHVHSEKELTGGKDRWVGIQQGVTTQLLAPDGFSWAHLQGEVKEEMRQYLEVFYGQTSKDWGGDTVDAFLDHFEGKLPSHIALQVPHGAIRASVMGWATKVANDQQLDEMRKLTKEWMLKGATAFCTGLEYEPTVHCDLRELVELSKVTWEYGGIYVAHQRGPLGHKPFGTAETVAISQQSGIPVHISHYAMDASNAASANQALADGIDLTFDMYPYPAGCTHLMYYLPPWAQAGSPADVLQRLRSKQDREQMADYLRQAFPPQQLRLAAIQSATYAPFVGQTLAEIEASSQIPLSELICDMLLSSKLQAMCIFHWHPDRERFLQDTFTHDKHIVSSDGIFVEGSPHPRGYGTFPTILGSFVREKGWLTLEQAIHSMTRKSARRFQIANRGLIAKGYAADLVMFDPQTVTSKATFSEPRIAPEGIHHVWVDGELVLHNSEITGRLPGKVLRK